MHIAILDDDPGQRQLLAALVEAGGHRASRFASGPECLEAIGRAPFDLLLLDWMMPGMDGGAVLRALRARPGPALPVIVVTARDDEAAAVAALRLGADDYLVKPPKAGELLARIDARARRDGAGARASRVRAGRFEIDPQRRSVTLDGREVPLTLKEFDLAAYLFREPGTLVTRAALLESVWGLATGVDTRTVDTHASRVRRKLGLDGRSGWTLLAVYGHGYRLVADASA